MSKPKYSPLVNPAFGGGKNIMRQAAKSFDRAFTGMHDPRQRSLMMGVIIGFSVAFFVFYLDIFGIAASERRVWSRNHGIVSQERDEYREALHKVQDRMVYAEQRVSDAEKAAADAIGRAHQHVDATHRATSMALHAKDAEVVKHKMVAEHHKVATEVHKKKLDETAGHLKMAHTELSKVEGKEDAWERFHTEAVSKTIKYGQQSKFQGQAVPGADGHARVVVKGWRMGQRVATRGGSGPHTRRMLM